MNVNSLETPMLTSIVDNPKLDKYVVTFEAGQTLFLEGDDSRDLYIVVEGNAAVLKGSKIIAEISGKGSVFGEMSFLLRINRTATVRALTSLKLIKIPEGDVPDFLKEFPEVVWEFARYLANRLHETSQIVYGLKEFSDKIPDAVILTDKEGKILSWNRAAEKLYGREEDLMRYRAADEIYEDRDAYRSFLKEAISGQTVIEKTLKIRHPREGIRYVSTSTTLLYDAQQNFEGVLFLGRDVTQAEAVAKRYQRVKRGLIPLSILLVLLLVGIFFAYPYFSKGYHVTDAQKHELQDDLAVAYRLLRSLLAEPFTAEDRQKTTDVMKHFFDAQKGVDIPFTGLVLLGKDKRVFDAYSILPGVDAKAMIGSSYSGIDLGDRESAPYKVLTLYRENKDHPMGIRHTEIAFRLKDIVPGWLIFQVDMALLKRKFDLDEEDLRTFRFEGLK